MEPDVSSEQALDMLRLTQSQLLLFQERQEAARVALNATLARAGRVYEHLSKILAEDSMATMAELEAAVMSKQAVDDQVHAAKQELNQVSNHVIAIGRDVDNLKRSVILKVSKG